MYERNTLLSKEKDSSFFKKWSVFSKQERNDLLGDYEPPKSTFDKKKSRCQIRILPIIFQVASLHPPLIKYSLKERFIDIHSRAT